MLENVYMHQNVFMTTIDTMLFSVSFTEILMSYGSSVRSWTPQTRTPTDPTGSPEYRKNHLDEVQSRIWHRNSSRRHMCYLNVFAILYCMAYDVLKQTMYSMY